jgi:DNA-binding NtrC family response regulator
MIKQLLLDASDGEITIEDVEKVLPKNIDSAFMHYADVEHLFDLPLREAREMFEKEYLVHQLNIVNGSVSKLADRVGMERTHLYRKLRSLGIGAKDSA